MVGFIKKNGPYEYKKKKHEKCYIVVKCCSKTHLL